MKLVTRIGSLSVTRMKRREERIELEVRSFCQTVVHLFGSSLSCVHVACVQHIQAPDAAPSKPTTPRQTEFGGNSMPDSNAASANSETNARNG